MASCIPKPGSFHGMTSFSFCRQNKLEESLLYQQFLVGVDEEDSWLNEKITLVSSSEVGDTLAAVQVSTAKSANRMHREIAHLAYA